MFCAPCVALCPFAALVGVGELLQCGVLLQSFVCFQTMSPLLHHQLLGKIPQDCNYCVWLPHFRDYPTCADTKP